MSNRKLILKSALALLALTLTTSCAEKKTVETRTTPDYRVTKDMGGQTGNGGFLIYWTSRKLLDKAQSLLLERLNDLHQSGIDEVLKAGSVTKPVDLLKLKTIISEMKKDKYTGEPSLAVNPSGQDEVRHFTYERKQIGEGSISAEPLFFVAFAGQEISNITVVRVMRDILHEALHVFDLEEQLAGAVSSELLRQVGLSPSCASELKLENGDKCYDVVSYSYLLKELKLGFTQDSRDYQAEFYDVSRSVSVELFEHNGRISLLDRAKLEGATVSCQFRDDNQIGVFECDNDKDQDAQTTTHLKVDFDGFAHMIEQKRETQLGLGGIFDRRPKVEGSILGQTMHGFAVRNIVVVRRTAPSK